MIDDADRGTVDTAGGRGTIRRKNVDNANEILHIVQLFRPPIIYHSNI